MRIFSLTIIALIAAISSCSTTNTESEIGTADNVYNIEIENNQKWEVVEEMMVHIRNMDNDIQSVQNGGTSDLDGLGESLQENIHLLTSNCTMTGKAHDELHKWLIPFIDLVQDLNESSSIEEKQSVFQSLEKSMTEFNAYFE